MTGENLAVAIRRRKQKSVDAPTLAKELKLSPSLWCQQQSEQTSVEKDSTDIQISPEVTQERTRTQLHYFLRSEELLGGALALGLKGNLDAGRIQTEDPGRWRTTGQQATTTRGDPFQRPTQCDLNLSM